MSAQIKDALAALVAIEENGSKHFSQLQRYNTVRLALECAARERQALETINAWIDADDERYQSSGRQYGSGYYLTLYPKQMSDGRHPFYGETRLEAQEAAAKWCRSELAK